MLGIYVQLKLFLLHYENMPMQYVVKNEKFQLKMFAIFIFAQNRDCGYTLEPPRRCSSNKYNLCLGAKIKKIGIPMHTPVLLYKSGV